MLTSISELKKALWVKFRSVFNRYSLNENEICPSKVDQLIIDVLQNQLQTEKDYVLNSAFRLDSTASGVISFIEMGNFIFERHCSDMTLQRWNKNGKFSHCQDREITEKEFCQLLNQACLFLQVNCPAHVAAQIFKITDTDKNGLISYVEYFLSIQKHICQVPDYKQRKAEIIPDRQAETKIVGMKSKLRRVLWDMPRKLFDLQMQGRVLKATDQNISALLNFMCGYLSEDELSFLTVGLFRVGFKWMSFQSSETNFGFYHGGDLSLSRYTKNHPAAKKTLTNQQFITVFKNSFAFIKFGNFKASILSKIFAKIDKNDDGLISYDEYENWIRRFVLAINYADKQFYVEEDDEDKDSSYAFENPQGEVKPKIEFGKFNFTDHSLGQEVREKMQKCLSGYNEDNDDQFSRKEIEHFLIECLKKNQSEIEENMRNLERFNRDGDSSINIDEITNFCMEYQFGEVAVQKMILGKEYSRGAQKMMNEQQFSKTLNKAIEVLSVKVSPNMIKKLFSQIDLDHDGWIPFAIYTMFMKYYFGSVSVARINTISSKKNISKNPQIQKWLSSLKGLSPVERFARIIIDQLHKIFINYDYNKNLSFESNEIADILEKVFQLEENDATYILFNFFNLDKSNQKGVSFETLISIVLNVYFVQILIKKRYYNTEVWKSNKISLEEFIILISDGCFFIKIVPSIEDLKEIFKQLDNKFLGFITFDQYTAFVKKSLGGSLEITETPKPVTSSKDLPKEEISMICRIWKKLREYFIKNDNGHKGVLNQEELVTFIKNVLNETSQREIDFVFWNLFRTNSSSNPEVTFETFAPFILGRAGQIALQRFHTEQESGKGSLTEQEFYIVLKNGYRSLTSIPNEKAAINKIFSRIETNGSLSYADYLRWVHKYICANFQQ